MKKSSKEKREARGAPRVFVSSTSEDLEAHRQIAKDAALHADVFPVMHEYWEAKDNDPYDECMQRVDGCDVLVVIVAQRYGWEPPDQPCKSGEELKSITWLECERAVASGKQVLAFLLEDGVDWPKESKDADALEVAMKQHGAASKEFIAAAVGVERRIRRLAEFRRWLETRGVRRTFKDSATLRHEIGARWRLGKPTKRR
ncbi:MAG: DUF4062 domain-containing protein [Planctomycetota bacterium]